MNKQKKIFKEIKNKEKIVDKKGFSEYFSYEPTSLVNKFLGQNTQDLDEIKQHNIKLNEDERSSTNNKNKNDELNNILSVIDRIYKFFEYRFLPGEQPDESNLPKWIKVSKQRFNVIKKKFKMQKLIIYRLDQKGVKLLILTNQINYVMK